MSTEAADGSSSPLTAMDTVASRWFFRGLLAGAAFLASAQYAIRSLPAIDAATAPGNRPVPAPGPVTGNPIPSGPPPAPDLDLR